MKSKYEMEPAVQKITVCNGGTDQWDFYSIAINHNGKSIVMSLGQIYG